MKAKEVVNGIPKNRDKIKDRERWLPHMDVEDRFFVGEKGQRGLRENFSEVEIGNFMKVLNVKPHKQWEDESTYHYKLGAHTYEDESQELDPEFHILSEVEREAAAKIRVAEWRRGSEIKIEVGDKVPRRTQYRF